MLTASRSNQAQTLAKSVRGTGQICVGEDAFYMGSSVDWTGIWSVRCSTGGEWTVSIETDSEGTSRVLNCEVL